MSIARMNYRKLHDDITEVVAEGLYYIENYERIRGMKTAAEVNESVDGGLKRYMVDPVYHAKVQMLVAHLTSVVRSNIEQSKGEGTSIEEMSNARAIAEVPAMIEALQAIVHQGRAMQAVGDTSKFADSWLTKAAAILKRIEG